MNCDRAVRIGDDFHDDGCVDMDIELDDGVREPSGGRSLTRALYGAEKPLPGHELIYIKGGIKGRFTQCWFACHLFCAGRETRAFEVLERTIASAW